MIDRIASGLLLAVLLQCWGPAATWAASTISVTGGELVLAETTPAASLLGVAQSPTGNFTVIDWAAAPIAAGTGCTPDPSLSFLVFCTGPVTRVRLSMGEGDDEATMIGSTPATIDGGPGDDQLTGGDGNDVLRGGVGADVLVGGAGTDTADYANHPLQPVMATPDGIPDDGAPREGDYVQPDVELAVTLPAPTTVTLDCDELRVRTHDAADNTIGVAISGSTIIVIDWTGHAVAPGSGCSAVYPFLVSCPSAGITRTRVDTGDGNDLVGIVGALPAIVHGGAGNDTLGGGDAADVLLGGPGNDSLNGGLGNDVLDGGLGADVLIGGAGTDRVNYRGHANQPVSVTFGNGANDGGPGEGDDARADVESATTTPASPVVWLFGDSNTHGYGHYVVDAKPEWDVVSLGVGGETAAGGLIRVVNTLVATPSNEWPDVAIVMYGTNDIVHGHVFMGEPGFTPAEVGANVDDIATWLEAAGARVIIGFPLGAPTQYDALGPELNATLAAMQAEYDAQIPFFDRCSSGRENVDFRLQSNSQFANNLLGAFHASEDVYENDWVLRAVRGIEQELAAN